MAEILLALHPAAQVTALVLALWALWLGGKRFLVRFGRQSSFAWRRHVWVGSAALLLWMMGAAGGGLLSDALGRAPGLGWAGGAHSALAGPIVALCAFGLASGLLMHIRRRPRRWLPLIHGGANTVLVLLALAECWIGYALWLQFAAW